MKILKYILTLFLIKISIAGTFSELRGMEDSLGNTHLFYRIYYVVPGLYSDGYDNSIYHYDLSNSSDTLFLIEYVQPEYFGWPYDGGGKTVLDFDFWNLDPYQFIYCGFSWGTDIGFGYICRYDSVEIYWIYGSPIASVKISKQNDSLLFASNMEFLFKSNDCGHVWEELYHFDWGFQLINISPFMHSILFSTEDSHICKSIDGGLTFTIVDSMVFNGNKFYFDSDSIHIYGVSIYDLFRSSNFGDNWEIVYSDSTRLNITIDSFISGRIYLSRSNQILVSDDFGNSFQLFAELDNPIIGLYKKPIIDKIYAATPLDIYEIDYTGIHLLKHLTAIENDDNISAIPMRYKLEQNFPNPFNSATTISYKVKESGHIKILLFDVSGQKLEVLLNKYQTPGDYYFQYDAKDRSSGIYFYRLIVNDNPVATKKMVLIK